VFKLLDTTHAGAQYNSYSSASPNANSIWFAEIIKYNPEYLLLFQEKICA
jgi:hypothetical protein